MPDVKPINEKIVAAIAELLQVEEIINDNRQTARDIKKRIHEDVKDMGFDIKAFNKILNDFRILKSPAKKQAWLEQQKEIARIEVALHQPTLFEYARKNGVNI